MVGKKFQLLSFLFAASLSFARPQNSCNIEQLTSQAQSLKGIGDGLNYAFTASDSPRPFTIDVDPDFIAATRLKSALYRPTRPIKDIVPAWADGPPASDLAKLQKYFLEQWSWEDVQSQLNKKYEGIMYTSIVSGGPNYTEPVHLHFAHQKSDREDAIPLLMVHGFPSSFLEFEDVIQPLANPPNSSLPAFHVVTPGLPGFAFSPQPAANGLGSRETGIAFNNLMLQLGYKQYVIYVTDLGATVGRWMCYDAAEEIVSRFTGFYFVLPNENDLGRYAKNETNAVETEFLDRFNPFNAEDAGYIEIQGTKPLALAEAMTDSFIGWAAWQWNYRYHASGAFDWSYDDLLTQAYILYIQGVYGTFQAYKTWAAEGALNDTAYPSSNIPTGLMHLQSGSWGRDDCIQYALDSWIERTANVTFSRTHPAGGHFAAEEVPELFLEDVWAYFSDPSISGVDKIHK